MMILCCKTCGNTVSTGDRHKCCNYCGNEMKLLVSEEEASVIPTDKLPWIIHGLQENLRTSANPCYNENLWNIREQKDGNEHFQISEKDCLEKADQQKITTGYNFDGYHVVKYMDVVHAQTVIGTGFLSELSASIDDFFGTTNDTFEAKLKTARQITLQKLKMESARLGGNAVLAIKFDYITFSSNMIGVIANGTSVIIKGI